MSDGDASRADAAIGQLFGTETMAVEHASRRAVGLGDRLSVEYGGRLVG